MAEKEEVDIPRYKLTKYQEMKQFFWNPNTKQFFGRTGLSWLKITIFYIIFYACLAAFWALMLVIFYQTLDYHEPKWKLTDSRIGDNPGLGYRPRPPLESIESTLINLGDEKMKKHYIADLKAFIDDYYQPDKNSGAYVEDESKCNSTDSSSMEDRKKSNKFCKFNPISLNPTSGEMLCNEQNSFGYETRQPCIMIKLNRIFDWTPKPYKDKASAPAELIETLNSNGIQFNTHTIYITCKGQDANSRESVSSVKYFTEGIDFRYFPYRNQPGYLSPFIWVQFEKFSQSVVIFVECKAWAANIKHNLQDREGSVAFEIMM